MKLITPQILNKVEVATTKKQEQQNEAYIYQPTSAKLMSISVTNTKKNLSKFNVIKFRFI